jgi:hypothetical protein
MVSFFVVRDSLLSPLLMLLVNFTIFHLLTTTQVLMVPDTSTAGGVHRLINVVTLPASTRAGGCWALGVRATTVTVSQANDAVNITMTIGRLGH